MNETSDVMRILVVALLVGNVIALAAGLALLAVPKRVVSMLGMRNKHPVTGRRLTKSLERPRDAEKTLLRYPIMLGVALLAGGLFVLIKWFLFVRELSVADGAAMLMQLFPGRGWSIQAWEPIWITLLSIVLIGAVLAIVVGALAFISANKLKKLSAFANQWVSTRQAAKPVSQPYYGLDRLVSARPQAWGVIISVLALYTLAMLFYFGGGLF